MKRILAGFSNALLVGVMMFAATEPVVAQGLSKFYSGKTLQFIIGGEAKGDFNAYARTIGRHLIKFMPGKPSVYFRNMSGASGRKAANWLFNSASPDGLTIGAISPDAIMTPLVGNAKDVRYDPVAFKYIGSAASTVSVCIVRKDAPVTTFSQVFQRRLIMGADMLGGPTRDVSIAMMKLLGAKFELVPRYNGLKQLVVAQEQGEIHGFCGMGWFTLRNDWSERLSDKKITVLVQYAVKGHPELDKLGVPTIWDFVKDENDRAALELLASALAIGRPYVAPPRVERAKIIALRIAFERTVRDIDYRADARKARLNVTPTLGDDVQSLVEKLYRTPANIVNRARVTHDK
jgi:tripartite-type tricarboxylate transporter receptor subunit TctC